MPDVATTSNSPAGKTVLVTGGSGFVGGHVIVELLRRGYRVHTTIRNLAREAEVRAMLDGHADTSNLRFFAADLLQDAGWAAATEGADYVLHVASPMPIGEYRGTDVITPARAGTRRVLKAAQNAGVTRVVITSSTAAAMPAAGSQGDIDEAVWTDLPQKPEFDYPRAKTLAEQDAWTFVHNQPSPFELVTLLPAQIQGPVLGSDYSASVDIIRLMLAGKLPAVPRVGYNIVDVRDLAELHVLAMIGPGAAGQRIIVASDFMWFSDMADTLREALGEDARRAPRRTLPDFIVRVGALFNPEMRQLKPSLGKRTVYSKQKAESLLGRPLRSGQEAILAAAHSLMERKLV